MKLKSVIVKIFIYFFVFIILFKIEIKQISSGKVADFLQISAALSGYLAWLLCALLLACHISLEA